MRKGKRFIRSLLYDVLLCLLIFALLIVFSLLINLISRINVPGFEWIYPSSDVGPDFFKYASSICALIAALFVVVQLRKEAESERQETLIQQSTFIREYNQAFIENKQMTKVEQELEEYYYAFVNTYKEINPDKRKTQQDLLIQSFKKNIGKPGDGSRQDYINYLVYLEGLATVILNGAMSINNIDGLFGYRFFIAVNNKAIQEEELVKYPIHYQGIYTLFELWAREKRRIDKKFPRKRALYKPTDSPEEYNELYGIPMCVQGYALSQTKFYKKMISGESIIKFTGRKD